MKTIYDFVQEAQKQIAFNNEQNNRFDSLVTENLNNIDSLQERKDGVFEQLAEIVTPGYKVAELTVLSKKIQNPRVADLASLKVNEINKLTERIKVIENNSDFQKSDAMINPKSGVIAMQKEEITPMLNKASEEMKTISNFEGFKGLYERKFGTDLYPHNSFLKFLNPEYLEDWKNSDKIVEALGEKDFVDVIYKYDEAKRIYTELQGSLDDLTEQENKIITMVEEYKNTKEALKNIDKEYNKKLGRAIIEFTKSSDKETILNFTNSYNGSAELITAIDGIEHQSEYLSQLNKKISSEKEALFEKSNKIADEANRYSSNPDKYANKRFENEQFNRRFNRDQNRYNKIVDKYHNTSHQIYVYNDYSRNSFLDDFLWYDIMTDGTLDGNFIPQVQEYYNYHPNYQRNDYNYNDNNNDNEFVQDNS